MMICTELPPEVSTEVLNYCNRQNITTDAFIYMSVLELLDQVCPLESDVQF